MYTFETLKVKDLSMSKENPRGSVAYADLAKDIERNGLINPITVHKQNGGFEVVAGHRRLAAVKHLGWTKVPCHIVDKEDADVAIMRLKENVARKDLTTYEQGNALMEIQSTAGWSLAELAKQTGYTKSMVAKYSMLLGTDKLHATILDEWKKAHPLLTMQVLCDRIYCGGDHEAQLKAWEEIQKIARTGAAPTGADSAESTEEGESPDSGPQAAKPKALSGKKMAELAGWFESLDSEIIPEVDRNIVVAVLRWAAGQTVDIKYADHVYLANPLKIYEGMKESLQKAEKAAKAKARTEKKSRAKELDELAKMEAEVAARKAKLAAAETEAEPETETTDE